jgi:hypothetical protein
MAGFVMTTIVLAVVIWAYSSTDAVETRCLLLSTSSHSLDACVDW